MTAAAGPACADPAHEFVRRCLHLRRAPDELEALRRAAAAGVDWSAVRALVAAERLAPLLHHAVGRRGILPADVAAEWHQGYRIEALRNRVLLHELGICLRAFAAAGVEVIVLKGAALAAAVYGDVALRPMVDLDLLIRPRARAAAERVLHGLGYAATRAEVRPGALAAEESELDFCRPGTPPLHVDLHWHLFDSPHHQRRIDPDWYWDSADATSVAGEPARILGPEAQILHLCGHLMLHHAGQGLLWWQDLAELLAVHAARLDWDGLLARVRRDDLVLPLRAALLPLADDWHAPVPPPALAALRALRPSADEAWLFARLTRPQRSAGERFWTDLASMPGWGDRIRFALANLFPSAAYMRRRYAIRHTALLPFSYPYRWLRGLLGW